MHLCENRAYAPFFCLPGVLSHGKMRKERRLGTAHLTIDFSEGLLDPLRNIRLFLVPPKERSRNGNHQFRKS